MNKFININLANKLLIIKCNIKFVYQKVLIKLLFLLLKQVFST